MIIEKSENGHDFFSTEWIDKEISFVFTDITADGISAYFRPGTSSKFLNVNQDIITTSNETEAPWASSTSPGKQKGSFLLLYILPILPLSPFHLFSQSPLSLLPKFPSLFLMMS